MDYKKLPKDIADKFKHTETDENLTRSPDVNRLIRVSNEIKEGKTKPEALKEQLEALYTLHRNMVNTFDYLSKTQPVTEISKERLPLIQEDLEDFKEAIDEIKNYLDDNNIKHIDWGVIKLIDTTEAIFESADILKEDEEKTEVFCDSPILSELIRIGKGVSEGIYEAESLKKRVEACRVFHKAVFENMQQVMKDTLDTDEAEEEGPLIIEALELMEDGFAEIEDFFNDNDTEHIVEGIEMIKQASEELSSSYKILMAAVETDEETEEDIVIKDKVCFKCNIKLNNDVKICPKCHTPIPEIKQTQSEEIETPTARVDVTEHVGIAPMMTPNVKKIYDSAVGFMQNKISEEEFISTLDWLEGLLTQSEESLKREKLPELPDEREREIMLQTKLIFETGIKESKEGITEMRLYIEEPNTSHLQNGILQVIRGGERLYQVQLIAKKIQSQAKEIKDKK